MEIYYLPRVNVVRLVATILSVSGTRPKRPNHPKTRKTANGSGPAAYSTDHPHNDISSPCSRRESSSPTLNQCTTCNRVAHKMITPTRIPAEPSLAPPQKQPISPVLLMLLDDDGSYSPVHPDKPSTNDSLMNHDVLSINLQRLSHDQRSNPKRSYSPPHHYPHHLFPSIPRDHMSQPWTNS